MLSLNSQRWSELHHAYGAAADMPDRLRSLYNVPEVSEGGEPWGSIWSALAHQGDVYSASFAAVPHVVEALSRFPEQASFSYFNFPAWVEICRFRKNVDVPSDLHAAYAQALRRLPGLISPAASRNWDRDLLLSAMTALAVGMGFPEIAEAAVELTSDVVPDFMAWVQSR